MPVTLEGLLRDWAEETFALASVLHTLAPEDWEMQTPAPSWTIRHQVAHLAWTDEALHLASTSPTVSKNCGLVFPVIWRRPSTMRRRQERKRHLQPSWNAGHPASDGPR